MKKIKIIILIIFSVSMYNCKAQSHLQQINNYKTKIIGTWISDDSPEYKIKFSTDGIQKEYLSNVIQEESYHYSVEPSCGSNASNNFDVYLKRYILSHDFTCDVVNNIEVDENGKLKLSITTERGKLETYTKQ